jgi:hypothetical protein
MIALEDPPGFVVRTEAQKAAWDNGFRLEQDVEHGWLHYTSTTAPGSVWIAGASQRGPWLLSINHLGASTELGGPTATSIAGPGIATFMFETLTQLHGALDRVYKLAVSLPDVPLSRFRAKTAGLPRTTEAERLVIQRIGQDIFRDALMHYWGGLPNDRHRGPCAAACVAHRLLVRVRRRATPRSPQRPPAVGPLGRRLRQRSRRLRR